MKYHPWELCHFSFCERNTPASFRPEFWFCFGKARMPLSGRRWSYEIAPSGAFSCAYHYLWYSYMLISQWKLTVDTSWLCQAHLQLSYQRSPTWTNIYQVISETSRSWFTWKKVFCVICGVWSFIFVFQTQEKSLYETVADDPESWQWWRADFQSGSRVLKKGVLNIFWFISMAYNVISCLNGKCH